MMDSWLFNPSGLTPHGFCLLWRPGLIWMHAVSDSVIGIAYFCMSIALAYFAQRRRDLAFRPVFWLFAAFILLCGLSHVFDTLTLWVPAYGEQGLLKVATGLVSVLTAALLWRILPQALAMPSPAEYRETCEALRISEGFLDRTGRAAGIGGWELDLRSGHLNFTGETCRIHGVAAGFRPTLAQALNFYAPEARAAMKEAVERCIASGAGIDLELPFIRADGSRIWVRTVATRMTGDDASPVRLSGAIQDVSAAVIQRQALEAAGERITLATETGGIGIWEWDFQSDAVAWNDQMYRLHGLTRSTPILTSLAWRRLICPDDVAQVNAWAGAALAGDGPPDNEFRVVWPDGSLRHLRAVARTRSAKDDGHLVMVGVLWDVTEARTLAADRDRQAALLAESEANFRLLAENASDMIARIDADGNRRYVSPACRKIFGVPPEALLGRALADTIHPADTGPVTALLADMLHGVVTEGNVRYRVLHPERGEVWVETSARAVGGSAGGAATHGFITIARDVTDRVLIEQELRRANEELGRYSAESRSLAAQAGRARTRFLAGMSHEMRTPLNVILGYAQLLHMEGGLTGIQAERVQAMRTAGTHLLELIHCVLDLSEIESDGAAVQTVMVDLPRLAEATLDIVRPAADAKLLSLGLAIGPGVPQHAIVDPKRLRQVLLNLLGNAVKFTPSGRVELRVDTAAGARLRFVVADTGPGVPAEQRHRLFKEFETIESEVQTEGTGLGLSFAARFTTLMGGQLTYEDNPGGGSLFCLEVPVESGSPPVDGPEPAPPAEAPPPPAPLPVLVVDDIAMNRDIAAAFIRSAGYPVVCVDGGAAAVAAVAADDFLVVLMDVRMPEMDGLEATRQIRRLDGPRAQVPIIALTAQIFAEQIEACHAAGMDSHLAKPFTLESLLGAVARSIETGQARSTAGMEPPAAEAIGADLQKIDGDLPDHSPSLLDAGPALVHRPTLGYQQRGIAVEGEPA